MIANYNRRVIDYVLFRIEGKETGRVESLF
jgi:hypothetical protein